ncbi:hypothetical protein QMA73_09480, partial [Burkholderia pseudomallei]|nr:hypothetical protein [Burkholderia pseudomallei]
MSRTISRHPRRRTDSPAAQRAPAGRTSRAAGEAAACNAKPPRATSNKKGSSRNPGERGADLEEEVLLVAVPVSA